MFLQDFQVIMKCSRVTHREGIKPFDHLKNISTNFVMTSGVFSFHDNSDIACENLRWRH